MLKCNDKIVVLALLLLVLVACVPVSALAASGEHFKSLIDSGGEIFKGLKDIIYPASAVGIIAICMGGFFGNINWKWLTAIVIGLVVISACAAFISMFSPEAITNVPKGTLEEGI